MAELNDELLDEALNFISNSEAAKEPKSFIPEKDQDDQLNEIFDKLGDNFADDILKNISEVNVDETNELIENVLGELMSKEILYEPFLCLKLKLEKDINQGNSTQSSNLEKVTEIIKLMDLMDNDKSSSKNRERLMQLIYDLQEQGDLWSSLSTN